jgi:ATP-dependent DNA helicase RecG
MLPTVQQSFDRQPVPDTSLEDLDLALVDATIRAGQDSGRYDGPRDPRTYLIRFGGGVIDGAAIRPTVAGVLAFTHEPERWLTASGIDIAIYRSDQISPTAARVRQMRGSIFDVIDSTVAILQDECTIGRMEGARVVNELDTPLAVLRELTTNAVVHRDLSLFGSQVRIQVFPRYIEWISPGGLPTNITIATLLTAQFSRNPGLAQFLFHRAYIEKFGMGLDLVIEAMRRERLGSPEFHDDMHSFRVRVPRKQLLATHVPDMSTRDGRAEAILMLFQERGSWRQHELMERLQIPRSTLQRDLEELVQQQRLIVRGATKSRIYILPSTERPRDS